MPNFSTKKTDYATRASQLAQAQIDLYEQIVALTTEWFTLQYNAGGANAFEDEDFIGDNQHISAATLQDAIFTYTEIQALLTGAHLGNLYEIAP